MPVRVAVFSQPRSGTHFITRSLARSAKVPYCVNVHYGARYDIPVNDPEWIIATHDPFTNEIAGRLAEAGAVIVGVTRNPLDHLLSLLGHREDLTEAQIVQAAKDPWVHDVRRHMMAVPEDRRVSYDLLADADAVGHAEEVTKLEVLAGIKPVTPEAVSATRAALGIVQVTYARPGRWRDVLSAKGAKAVAQAMGEGVPE